MGAVNVHQYRNNYISFKAPTIRSQNLCCLCLYLPFSILVFAYLFRSPCNGFYLSNVISAAGLLTFFPIFISSVSYVALLRAGCTTGFPHMSSPFQTFSLIKYAFTFGLSRTAFPRFFIYNFSALTIHIYVYMVVLGTLLSDIFCDVEKLLTFFLFFSLNFNSDYVRIISS